MGRNEINKGGNNLPDNVVDFTHKQAERKERPRSFVMSDFVENQGEILNEINQTGKDVFLKDNANPGRVLFWIFPVSDRSVMRVVMPLLLESKSAEYKRNEDREQALPSGVINIFSGGEKRVEEAKSRSYTYTRGEFEREPQRVFEEISEVGGSLITQYGRFTFAVVSIDPSHQEGLEKAFSQGKDPFVQEMKRHRDEWGIKPQ